MTMKFECDVCGKPALSRVFLQCSVTMIDAPQLTVPNLLPVNKDLCSEHHGEFVKSLVELFPNFKAA